MSTSEDERLARAALSLTVEPGQADVLELVRKQGARARLAAITSGAAGARYDHIAERIAAVDPAAELTRAHERGIRFVIPGDDEWPVQLDDLACQETVQERGEVPIGLWVSGPLSLSALGPSVAIVGSRDSTTYGDQVAADIAYGLGLEGFVTISGAAIGIDYAAHRGAVAAEAPTVAVLACGVDRDYPPRHSEMLRYLRAHGAVVSEVPMGGAPQRVRFLSRNRLIAALSRGTVVVEAAARSGALNTLNWAQRLNRMTMGVPGPVTSVSSLGVHHQIRTGGAELVTSAADVLELVAEVGEHLTEFPRGHEQARDGLSLRERQILDAVPVYQGAEAGSIARVAGLDPVAVHDALPELEQSGLVERDGAGWRLAEAARA